MANSYAAVSHLDRKVTSGLTPSYDSGTDTTTWNLPYSVNTNQTAQGHLTIARTDTSVWFEDSTQVANMGVTVSRPSATSIAVAGLGVSLASVPVVIGVLFTASFELSTIYQRNEKGGVEQRGRLRLGYLEMSYGPTTNVTLEVTPQGSASPTSTVFNDPTAQAGQPETMPFRVPIYARNEDTSIVFTDSTPGSFQIVMVDWEATLTMRSKGV